MTNRVDVIVAEIKNMQQDELDAVIDAVRRRRAKLIERAAERVTDTLRIGDTVVFDAKSRGVIKGVVQKVNTKTVKVKAVNGVLWTVHATLLTRVTAQVA